MRLPSDSFHGSDDPGDIKRWMWLPGLIVILVITCMVAKWQYGIPALSSLLALCLTFAFSFIAIQATGATGRMAQKCYSVSELLI